MRFPEQQDYSEENALNESTPLDRKQALITAFMQLPSVPNSGYLEVALNESDSNISDHSIIEAEGDSTFLKIHGSLESISAYLTEAFRIVNEASQLEKEASSHRSERKRHRDLVIGFIDSEVDKTLLTSFGKQDIKDRVQSIYNHASREENEGRELAKLLRLFDNESGGPFETITAQSIDSELFRAARQHAFNLLEAGEISKAIEQRDKILLWKSEHMNTFNGIEP